MNAAVGRAFWGLLVALCSACAGKTQSSLDVNLREHGRTIKGLKEGAWLKYQGDSIVEASYYYSDSLLFPLPKADFITSRFCIDSLSLCWKYPKSWTLEVDSNGVVAWSDRATITTDSIARPVITCALFSFPKGSATEIGSAFLVQSRESIAASVDSLVVLEDVEAPVQDPSDYGHKFTCKFYKGGVCYGLTRVIGAVGHTAITMTGSAPCDKDVFVQKLATFAEIASALEHDGKPVFDYNGVWKK